jgi:hypothetical protein
MKNWADQFPSLVAKIAKIEMNEDGRNSVLVALRPLLKFTRNGVPTTLLGKLICDELPGIIREEGIPLKHFGGSKVLNVPRTGAITTNEAVKLFGVNRSTLRRLHGEGNCLVTNDQRKKSVILYDKDSLASSIAIFRDADDCYTVAHSLGIPACFVSALAEHGLLRRVSDHDALLMTRGGELYDREAINQLATILNALPHGDAVSGISIDQALTMRREEADVWAEVFLALVDRRLPIVGYRSSNRGFVGSALVSPTDFDGVVSGVPAITTDERCVSSIVAAHILDWTDMRVAVAIREGLIRGSKIGREFSIPLTALREFRNKYILPNEIAVLVGLGIRSVSAMMRKRNVPAVFTAFRCAVYRRDDVLAVIAEEQTV